MTDNEKKEEIKSLTIGTLDIAMDAMKAKIKVLLDSGAINVSDWDINTNPMISIKAMAIALLQAEADQLDARGTSFEKEVKRQVNNFKHFV